MEFCIAGSTILMHSRNCWLISQLELVMTIPAKGCVPDAVDADFPQHLRDGDLDVLVVISTRCERYTFWTSRSSSAAPLPRR